MLNSKFCFTVYEHLCKLFQPAARVVRGCDHKLGVLHPSPHILIIFVSCSSQVCGEGEERKDKKNEGREERERTLGGGKKEERRRKGGGGKERRKKWGREARVCNFITFSDALRLD